MLYIRRLRSSSSRTSERTPQSIRPILEWPRSGGQVPPRRSEAEAEPATARLPSCITAIPQGYDRKRADGIDRERGQGSRDQSPIRSGCFHWRNSPLNPMPSTTRKLAIDTPLDLLAGLPTVFCERISCKIRESLDTCRRCSLPICN